MSLIIQAEQLNPDEYINSMENKLTTLRAELLGV